MGVARALAASTDLILMDEPFGALDPITRRELQDEFRRLQRQLGTTVVLVTHDLREACRLGDRLALLHQGRLLQDGPAAAFLRDPANDYVREFFRDAAAVDAGTRGPAVMAGWLDLLSHGTMGPARGHGGSPRAGHRGGPPRGARRRAAGHPRHARPLLERAAVGLTGTLQTIPSLALLGLPADRLPGQIGKPPALAALVLYALLPIVKNTILGLRSIDPGIREAALGLGMTGRTTAPPGRASPGHADRAGRDPRGDRGRGGHGDDRRGHRRTRAGELHLPRRLPLGHAVDPAGLGPRGLAGPGLRRRPGRDRAPARPGPARDIRGCEP